MSSTTTSYSNTKGVVSVKPVNWIQGSLVGALPFFSVQNGVLYFRSDDKNIYGAYFGGGTMQMPQVIINGVVKLGNKGCNFYSAPWCIPTLGCRDIGKRVEVSSIDDSIFKYIAAFYTNLTKGDVILTNFQLVTGGYAKQYQVLYGNNYRLVNGKLYFGATNTESQGVGGESTTLRKTLPLISSDYTKPPSTFDGIPIPTYQQPYNTFYAIDTPITISAIDTSNNSTELFFTFVNPVSVYNSPNFTN